MTAAYICDGCGAMVEASVLKDPYEIPPGWFIANFPRAAIACGADCIPSARESVKRRAQEQIEAIKRTIDTARFRKSKAMP